MGSKFNLSIVYLFSLTFSDYSAICCYIPVPSSTIPIDSLYISLSDVGDQLGDLRFVALLLLFVPLALCV